MATRFRRRGGATWLKKVPLGQALPSVYFLVPGYGSRGTAADVQLVYDQGRSTRQFVSRTHCGLKRYDVKDKLRRYSAAEAMAGGSALGFKEVQA